MSDLLLSDVGDGGDLFFSGGDIATDSTFGTAIYISLFGGNQPFDIYEKYKNTRDFLDNIILPVTLKNMLASEGYADTALAWMLTDGLVDSVKTSITSPEQNNLKIDILLTEGKTQTKYTIYWDNIQQKITDFNNIVGA